MIADQSSTNARSSSSRFHFSLYLIHFFILSMCITVSLLISVLILALIILIVLLSSTISIYYCHKHHHLSTRNLLQSFCFRSGNSRIEDNQLLNQIASNRLGEEEDDEDDNIQFSL
ncbi:Zinc finger protein 214 [Sarcoptes scabiei]|nr:Zinc finger protein 214 [Sarcoptes scabiei]